MKLGGNFGFPQKCVVRIPGALNLQIRGYFGLTVKKAGRPISSGTSTVSALCCESLNSTNTVWFGMYAELYIAIYRLSKLDLTNGQTEGWTDICTSRAAFAAENKSN